MEQGCSWRPRLLTTPIGCKMKQPSPEEHAQRTVHMAMQLSWILDAVANCHSWWAAYDGFPLTLLAPIAVDFCHTRKPCLAHPLPNGCAAAYVGVPMIADEPFVQAYGFIDKAALYLQVSGGPTASSSCLPVSPAVHDLPLAPCPSPSSMS